MRKPVKKDLQFDESRNHVKYPLDGVEKCLLRFALEFARHNLREFIAKYQNDTNLGNPAATRNELEELSQLVRDASYVLLLPLPCEQTVQAFIDAGPAVAELKADLEREERKKSE
jgi:hypothetical protein